MVEHHTRIIRESGMDDIPLIRDLAHTIWPEVYSYMISKEQIAYMLEKMYSKEAITGQMQSGHRFLLLEADGTPSGFASWSMEDGARARLHKLYLRKHLHGAGFGRFMLDHALTLMRHSGALSVELNVNRRNHAVGFYTYHGFRIEREECLSIGQGFDMDDFIMVKHLAD